jgi:hypothetical protein
VREITLLIQSLRKLIAAQLPEGSNCNEVHIFFEYGKDMYTLEIATDHEPTARGRNVSKHDTRSPRVDMEIPTGVSDCKSEVSTSEEGGLNE